jgi:hypothetical protein
MRASHPDGGATTSPPINHASPRCPGRGAVGPGVAGRRQDGAPHADRARPMPSTDARRTLESGGRAGGLFATAAWLLSGGGLPSAALGGLARRERPARRVQPAAGAALDGARLLRAMLWRRDQDRFRAAEASARPGRMLGTVLVAPGVAQFLLAGSGFGMCLALIGWFVRATAAEHQAAVTQRLKGRVTRNAIPAPPATACSWWTVEEFAAQLAAGYAGRRVVRS